MTKKYDIANEEPQMVSEPVAAYSYESALETHVESEWGKSDAPCMFSPDELRSVIIQSHEDKMNGRLHSHAYVQKMINSRIEAWR